MADVIEATSVLLAKENGEGAVMLPLAMTALTPLKDAQEDKIPEDHPC